WGAWSPPMASTAIGLLSGNGHLVRRVVAVRMVGKAATRLTGGWGQASPLRFQSWTVRATMTLLKVALPVTLMTGPSADGAPPETWRFANIAPTSSMTCAFGGTRTIILAANALTDTVISRPGSTASDRSTMSAPYVAA